jgi:hypothetical protein
LRFVITVNKKITIFWVVVRQKGDSIFKEPFASNFMVDSVNIALITKGNRLLSCPNFSQSHSSSLQNIGTSLCHEDGGKKFPLQYWYFSVGLGSVAVSSAANLPLAAQHFKVLIKNAEHKKRSQYRHYKMTNLVVPGIEPGPLDL